MHATISKHQQCWQCQGNNGTHSNVFPKTNSTVYLAFKVNTILQTI